MEETTHQTPGLHLVQNVATSSDLLSVSLEALLPSAPSRKDLIGALPGSILSDEIATQRDPARSIASGRKASLLGKVQEKISRLNKLHGDSTPSSTMHTTASKKIICHPKEWSEFVPVICQGWAASSIALADGRRQILSIALPGDIISIVDLFEPNSDRTVQALTEVTYCLFKRTELKSFIFSQCDLLDMMLNIWREERNESDQLALDLGKRSADGRIARLILRLFARQENRGRTKAGTMDFPLRQGQIADATGLTPVHVGKVLGKIQRAQIVELNKRKLTILNQAQLHSIAS